MSNNNDMLGNPALLLEFIQGPMVDLAKKIGGRNGKRYMNATKLLLRGDPQPFGEGVYPVNVQCPPSNVEDVKKALADLGFDQTDEHQLLNLGYLIKEETESFYKVFPRIEKPFGYTSEVIFRLIPTDDILPSSLVGVSLHDFQMYIGSKGLQPVTFAEALGFAFYHHELADKMDISAYLSVGSMQFSGRMLMGKRNVAKDSTKRFVRFFDYSVHEGTHARCFHFLAKEL